MGLATVAGLVDTVTTPKKLSSSTILQDGRFPIIDQFQSYICGWTNDDEAIFTKPLPEIVFGDHTCVPKFVDQPFAQVALRNQDNHSKQMRVDCVSLLPVAYRSLVTKQYKRQFREI